ncbi:uncharacterized protein LOC106655044 [Trichogramma pretiosum]|uniref:uncharacterized protein LOC106655044 n=1 Tax=Trichogramma pretiosum TaxID=7493 RepID=UPI000C71AF01|nr:uncharacterized protein LOC106655044 [Trichogramma pretiosum]
MIHSLSLRLIGDVLNIHDYKVNLFSKWMLKTIIQKSIQFSNDLIEEGYLIFIFWIYEEFSYLQNNLDVTRRQFFELMNKIFMQAAIDISNGKLLNKNLQLEEFFENGETEKFVEESTDIKFQDVSHEIVLHAIVDATYEIFGNDTDYSLIQMALLKQHQSYNYIIPYYSFRKPKRLGSQKKTDNKLKNTEKRISSMNKGNSFMEQEEFIQPLSKAMDGSQEI